MDRFNVFILAVACVFFCMGCKSVKPTACTAEACTPVELHGRLAVEGASLVNEKGHAVALRGVSLGWHNWWPRFFSKKTVAWMAEDWNIQLVRAAIGVDEDNAYLENPNLALQKLYEVVDAAIAEGIYVIIDWHSHKLYEKDAKAFFYKVAAKYHQYPNVIYEIYNEPIDDSWAEIKTYAEEVIDEIRSVDEHNIILVGCPHWDQDIHLVADDPIRGYDNIMYTLHFYAGTHGQWLRDRADYAIGKEIPLFISECAGMEASGDGPIDEQEWNKWVHWMAKHNLSWAAWSVADKAETCSMIRDETVALDNWSETDLKAWGNMIRNELKK